MKVDVTDFQETFTELKGATQLVPLLQQKVDIDDVQRALSELNKILEKKVDYTNLENILRDKASYSTVQVNFHLKENNNNKELLAQKPDLTQVQELVKDKVNKASVSTALKKKANKDEIDEQFSSLKKQFEQLRTDMDDYLRNKNENKPNIGTDAIVSELERVSAKHTTELNRIILDLDLKVSRAEVSDIVRF